MFAVWLFRYFFGYVRFETRGGFPERFLNLAARSGAALWQVTKSGETLSCFTHAHDYFLLRGPAKKAGVCLRVREKHGLPFLLHRYRKRVGFLSGLALFFVLLFVLSQFVWTNRITGNASVSSRVITQQLGELGLRSGSFSKNVDETAIQQELLLRMPELSWISIYIKGSTAEVEVRETVERPDILPTSTPCNIVAERDGRILSVEAYSGRREVADGAAVAAGQLLVTGAVDDKLGDTVFVHSSAKVMAETTRTLTVSVPLHAERSYLTDVRYDRRTLFLFGLEVPLYVGKLPDTDYSVSDSDSPLTLFGAELPIGTANSCYRRIDKAVTDMTEEEAEAYARALTELRKIDEMSDVQIKSEESAVSVSDGVLTLTTTCECIEDIAKQEEILMDHQEIPENG